MAGNHPAWYAVFDWDGVLVDSSRAHERSWELLADENGLTLPPDHFERGFGMRNEVIIPTLLHWTEDASEIRRLSLRKEALYREIVDAEGLTALPGVTVFLDRLEHDRIPRIIASSTHRENIACGLQAAGLSRYFEACVTSEDVAHGKPDPDVFLKAAERLGAPPASCVVFEDTPAGIEAGLRAGMHVVAVTTTHPAAKLAAAHEIRARLDDQPETFMNRRRNDV